jgi:hypothetical protein
MTTNLSLVPMLRTVELFLHSPICLHGTVLKYIIYRDNFTVPGPVLRLNGNAVWRLLREINFTPVEILSREIFVWMYIKESLGGIRRRGISGQHVTTLLQRDVFLNRDYVLLTWRIPLYPHMYNIKYFIFNSYVYFTHLQLVPRSRIRGSIHPRPHTPSWRNA